MAGNADGRPIILVVAGESMKGKTTALNNIFRADFPSGSTSTIQVRELRVHGKQCIMVDTPGFGIGDNSRVKREIADALRGLDFTLLFCVSCALDNDLEVIGDRIMVDLQNCLHNRIWEKCVLLLTHSDDVVREFKDENSDIWDTEYKDHVKKKAKAFEKILKRISPNALEVKTVFDYASDHTRRNAGFPGIVAVPVRSKNDSAPQLQNESGEREGSERGEEREGGRERRSQRGEEGKDIIERSPDIIPGIDGTESWSDVAMIEIENKTGPLEGELEKSNFKAAVATAGGFLAGAAAGAAAGAGAGIGIGVVGGPIGMGIGAAIGGPTGAVVGAVGGFSIAAAISYFRWIKTNKNEKIASLRNKIPH